jgi:hypothetical protein
MLCHPGRLSSSTLQIRISHPLIHHTHQTYTECHRDLRSRPAMAPPTLELYRSYFDDPTLSDLTIKFSDRTVHAHRITLCRASQYFTSLLTGSFQVIRSSNSRHSSIKANSFNRKKTRRKWSCMKTTQTPSWQCSATSTASPTTNTLPEDVVCCLSMLRYSSLPRSTRS